jgi:hypothetical protein
MTKVGRGENLKRRIISALLIIISVGITLALLEGVLRIVNYPKPVISGWKTLNSYPSERHQLGFRGQPIEYQNDDFVIVLVGDSQVEARACAYGWMPERRLEFYLNSKGKKVKVFSLGGPATGQDQQFLSLKEYYQKFRADMVIVWFTAANDVWNNTFPSNDDRTPKPTFWLEGGQLMGPTEMTGQPMRETPRLKLTQLWRKYFPYSREKDWAKFLPSPYVPMTSYNGPVNYDWQKRLEASPLYLRYENFDTDKNDRALYFTPRSPRVQYGLDLTRKLLQEMEQLAASHGGRFAIFRAENPPSATSGKGAVEDTVYILNGKFYQVSSRQYKENLDYLSQGFSSYIVPVTVDPANVGPEDAHLNEHANDQVMRDLAAAIESAIPARK